jgi:hypothetical protein
MKTTDVTGEYPHEEFWVQIASGGLCVSWSICLYIGPCVISLFKYHSFNKAISATKSNTQRMNNELEKMWKEVTVS